MVYNKPLPQIRDLLVLGKLARPYPKSRQDMIRLARSLNLHNDAVAFLRRFPTQVIFTDDTDFITRCEGLELLIQQEREAPKEALIKSED